LNIVILKPYSLQELVEKVTLLHFLWDYSQGVIIMLIIKDLTHIAVLNN